MAALWLRASGRAQAVPQSLRGGRRIPTGLLAPNFIEDGSLFSSDSSGGLAIRGLVGWVWSARRSTFRKCHPKLSGKARTLLRLSGVVQVRWPCTLSYEHLRSASVCFHRRGPPDASLRPALHPPLESYPVYFLVLCCSCLFPIPTNSRTEDPATVNLCNTESRATFPILQDAFMVFKIRCSYTCILHVKKEQQFNM